MKSDNIGNVSLFCREHRQWWNEGMATLTMHEIPRAKFDATRYLWGNVVVILWGPSWHTHNSHSLHHFLFRNWRGRGMWHSSQNRDVVSLLHKTSSNFIDMRLNTTHIWEVACSYHQNV